MTAVWDFLSSPTTWVVVQGLSGLVLAILTFFLYWATRRYVREIRRQPEVSAATALVAASARAEDRFSRGDVAGAYEEVWQISRLEYLYALSDHELRRRVEVFDRVFHYVAKNEPAQTTLGWKPSPMVGRLRSTCHAIREALNCYRRDDDLPPSGLPHEARVEEYLTAKGDIRVEDYERPL